MSVNKNQTTSSDETSLAHLAIGSSAIVEEVSAANAALRARLHSMGIIKGNVVKVMRAAPFGDPIDVRVLNSNIALRLSEAAQIKVRPL